MRASERGREWEKVSEPGVELLSYFHLYSYTGESMRSRAPARCVKLVVVVGAISTIFFLSKMIAS